MTREEKIAKIYDVIADKTLSYGCKMKSYYNQEIHRLSYAKNIKYLILLDDYCNEEDLLDSWKIIWHPVMIWDVLNWIENKHHWTYDSYNESPWTHIYNCLIWRPEKHRSIEEQNNDCVDFVYDLITDKHTQN